jgi:GntR family transcriptional regulator
MKKDRAVAEYSSEIVGLFEDLPKSRKPGEPLYQMVESHLRELITSGRLVPGDLIPSESQLAALMQVSQGTVKKAIDDLVWERLLYRHQGKGTYVSRVDFNNSLFRFFSYGDTKGQGVRIHKETILREHQSGSKAICDWLQVPEKTKLLYIERIGYQETTPVMIEHSWWPADVLPGMEDENVHIPDLLYAVVVEKFGIPVVRAEEALTAEAADRATAKVLKIKQGSPVVVLRRMTYTTLNRVLEVRETRGRADKFSYRTEIR